MIPWTVAPHPPSRLLCSWDSPGKSTGVGGQALLQGIFPTQGLNLYLLVSCTGRQVLYHGRHVIKHISMPLVTTSLCKGLNNTNSGVRMAEGSKVPDLLYSTGSSAQCSVMTESGGLEWGRVQREETYVYLEPTHVVVQQKQTQLCKASILQLRKKSYDKP